MSQLERTVAQEKLYIMTDQHSFMLFTVYIPEDDTVAGHKEGSDQSLQICRLIVVFTVFTCTDQHFLWHSLNNGRILLLSLLLQLFKQIWAQMIEAVNQYTANMSIESLGVGGIQNSAIYIKSSFVSCQHLYPSSLQHFFPFLLIHVQV